MRSVTRRAPSIKDQRRQEAFEALVGGLQAALAEGESLNKISVGRLAERSGISRSRFYAHFRDKGELMRTWFELVHDEIAGAFTAWWAIDADATIDDLREALLSLTLVMQPHVPMVTAMFDAAVYDQAVNDELARLVEHNIAALQAHIERGQADGWIDAELLPRPTAARLTWMAERAQSRLLSDASRKETVAQVNAYCDVVWHTLYAGAPSRR